MEQDDLMRRLREVVDRDEIRQALMRYCRGVDRADEALINSAFHPGAIDDHGQPRPATELARGVAQNYHGHLMHFTGNILIELDGDNADVESYFISFSPHEEDGKTYTRTRAGRYLDRFERRDGAWKMTYRMVVDEWARLDELKRAPEGIGVHRGVRSHDDPVFHLREILSENSVSASC
jgi:hypothetical protein